MKRPTPASLKKVTPENLARLGVERLAELLCAAGETKPELKRRLRMELAAEQGAEQLMPEIDRRLSSLQTSRSKVSWRQRPTFIRDLDALRVLIADRLADLDTAGALERLWGFMAVAPRIGSRLNDKHGDLSRVFQRAAADVGRLVASGDVEQNGKALAAVLATDPRGWEVWLPLVLDRSPGAVAGVALRQLSEAHRPDAAWIPLIRHLADGAGDIDAFTATFTQAAQKDASVAAEIARRLLKRGRVADAGAALEKGRARDVDFEWETVWIEYLELSGKQDEAQAQRWLSFERTLSVERARAFIGRLSDFDDVEAEQQAIETASVHADPLRGLRFLMEWPAHREAAALIEARLEEIAPPPDEAESWASQLEARFPWAAHQLLRKAAAAAFRRRDFKTCDRLTAAADAMGG